jgi:orotidine-5'-phosphate decarboxylase
MQKSLTTKYNFADHVIGCQMRRGSVLVCGLDPQPEYIPKFLFHRYRHIVNPFERMQRVIAEFNLYIIEAVYPFVCGYKPQAAFYERYLHYGWAALYETRRAVAETGLFCLLDAKRGDGGDTAAAYSGILSDVPLGVTLDGETNIEFMPGFSFDCMTVQPGIDEALMQPLLKNIKPAGKGLQLVVKTSFDPESRVEQWVTENGLMVWERQAQFVSQWSEDTEGEAGYRTIGVVLGATREKDADRMREILPNNLFLIPGYGAQGGGAQGAVRSFNKDGHGGMVNSSRGILYAYRKGQFACDEKDFARAAAKEAERSRNELNEALEQRIKSIQ